MASAAFGQLTRRLDDTWRKVKGVDELTPANLKEPLKEIRRALLEADVSLTVTRSFIKNVEKKATGAGVLRGLEPDQQLVKVVRDELVSLMGNENEKLAGEEGERQVVLMLGLQGVGKTTTCAKLANLLNDATANNSTSSATAPKANNSTGPSLHSHESTTFYRKTSSTQPQSATSRLS